MTGVVEVIGSCGRCGQRIVDGDSFTSAADADMVCGACGEIYPAADGGRATRERAPDLARLCASGLVRRWHQHPVLAETGQTLADHHGRCVQLLLALNPGASPALIRAVAFHDVGEFGAGDLSRDVKRTHPEIAARHAEIEAEARQAVCGADDWLSRHERDWLAFADALEAMVWVLMTRPLEAERRAGGWAGARADLMDRARALGCAAEVRRLLTGLEEGEW